MRDRQISVTDITAETSFVRNIQTIYCAEDNSRNGKMVR